MAFEKKSGKRVFTIEGGCTPASYIEIGMISNNVYFIEDGVGGVIVVDPSYNIERIMQVIDGRTVSAIFLTHCHWDHVGALGQLVERTGAPVYAGPKDADFIEAGQKSTVGYIPGVKVDHRVAGGQEITVGKTCWTAIATPGHTPDGRCYYLNPAKNPQSKGVGMLVSGDTLFRSAAGRTDFVGGSHADMVASLRTLSKLPGDTIVMPGHNDLTTIATEQHTTFRQYLG